MNKRVGFFKNHFDGDRVLSAKLVEGGIELREECDKYFKVVLTPDELEAFIAELREVAGIPAPVSPIPAIRQAVADYMRSEGCSCCRDNDAHETHQKRLAVLLDVPPYDDGSGHNFYSFCTEPFPT